MLSNPNFSAVTSSDSSPQRCDDNCSAFNPRIYLSIIGHSRIRPSNLLIQTDFHELKLELWLSIHIPSIIEIKLPNFCFCWEILIYWSDRSRWCINRWRDYIDGWRRKMIYTTEEEKWEQRSEMITKPYSHERTSGHLWNSGRKHLTPIKSWVYPKRRQIKARRHHIAEPKLNRLKQICTLAGSMTERKPDTRGSAEEEHSAQHKIHKTDREFSNRKNF
jgi:hypothetical protein